MSELHNIAPFCWTDVAILLIALAGANIYGLAARIKVHHLKAVCQKLLSAGVMRGIEEEALLLKLGRVYLHHPAFFFLSGDFSPLRNVRFLEAEALKFENGDYVKRQHGRKGTRT